MRIVVSALLALGGLAVAGDAAAHGELPAVSAIASRPGDPQTLLARTTFGLLYSRDGGARWDWVCGEAVPYANGWVPPVAMTPGGTSLVGSFDGLGTSPDGCSWARAPALENEYVFDLVVRGSSAFAVTSTFTGADGGTSLYRSRLFRADDDGRTFAPVGTPIDPTLLVDGLALAPSDAQRVYVTTITSTLAGRRAWVQTSKDGGTTWVAHEVALRDGERRLVPLAVDPLHADRVYLRAHGEKMGRVLVSDDGGATTRDVYVGRGELPAFALADGGSTVFVGGTEDGVVAASSADLVFAPRSSTPVSCLAATQTALFACATEGDAGFSIGRSTDGGRTFVPALRFAELRGPLACPPGSQTDVCAAEWPVIAATLGVPLPPRDAGADAAGPATDGELRGAGCSATTGPAVPSGALAGALALLGSVVARRRRR
jgi:MYXO-CTERM domain-containing protein